MYENLREAFKDFHNIEVVDTTGFITTYTEDNYEDHLDSEVFTVSGHEGDTLFVQLFSTGHKPSNNLRFTETVRGRHKLKKACKRG